MKLLFIDVDSLRPDHMGCYGYRRNTTPTIDKLAEEGVRFTEYYTSDAPCMPSRTALATGKMGIRTGLVNHGGEASRLRISEQNLDFKDDLFQYSLAGIFRQKGMETTLISTFAERHSAWHFNAGWNTVINNGKLGDEIASEVNPDALKWLRENGQKEDWVLYVNYWDPHTPYRTPEEYGEPFKNDPLPEWLTEEKLKKDRELVGPHSAREVDMYWNKPIDKWPRHVSELKDMADMRQLIDGYDTGVRYMDDHVAELIEELERQGIKDEVAIIITADHGENLGELGIYAEHGTADKYTCNIPMIIKYPGNKKGHVDHELHYSLDLLPTLAELLDVEASSDWDGQSFANTILEGKKNGREALIISQNAHVCQRSVRFKDWLYIRTYHDGYHLFDKHQLFNLKEDPHEEHNRADDYPEVVKEATVLLQDWHDEMMSKMNEPHDPMWTVLGEGGPFHANGHLEMYTNERLIPTGRIEAAEKLSQRHPHEFS
ncbi:sulfatase [Alkalibacterium iburiense]|uniref:Sulfatase n=1 Tax=Alkalibacterium iburiense TaxID=290589 RepID=A0ABP3H5J0_9LACT